jgi:hypothetical protein
VKRESLLQYHNKVEMYQQKWKFQHEYNKLKQYHQHQLQRGIQQGYMQQLYQGHHLNQGISDQHSSLSYHSQNTLQKENPVRKER